jgi:ribosome biogenesis protein MAK21
MQPLLGGDSKAVLLSSRSGHATQPLNTEAFWRKKAESVAVDEVFFHKYFSQIGKNKQAPSKKKGSAKGEDGEDEDADENEIWQALVESRPEVEGDSDESDMEMLDLDNSDADNDSDVDMSDGGVEINMDDDLSDIEGLGAREEALSSSEVESELEIPADDEDEDEEALFAKELQSAQPADEDKDGKETSRKRKQRLKKLPMFASMEDYAEMMDNDDDEDQGL